MDGAAFSPDGKHLVTWGNALIVWDTRTWEERFRRVDLKPYSVAFSLDGKSVVIDVGVIRFLDVTTGESRGATEVGHQYPIREVTLTPDGRLVISGDGLSTIRVWDAATGRPVSTVPGVGWDLLSLDIDPTGRCFMAASLHEVTRLFRTGDKEPLREFPGIPPFVRNRETVFRWGPAGEDAHPKPEERPLTSHAFAPDGASLALGTREGAVEVRDLPYGEVRERADAHEGAVLLVEYGSSGRFLYSLGADDQFRQWTVNPLKSTRTWKVDGVDEQGFADIALGVNRLATADRHGKLRLFDLDTGGKIGEYEIHDKRLARMEFSPDGNLIVTRGTERWDDPDQRWGVEFGPGYREMRFQFLDGLDGHRRFERRLASDPLTAVAIDDGRPVAFSRDGRYVALTERDRSDRAKMMIRPAIGIWEVATEERVLQRKGHQGDVWALSFSADGRSLVSGGSDKVVYLWTLHPDPETPGRTTSTDLEKLWKDLGGKDARAGYVAVWDLAARGSDAALFLRDRILGLLDLPVEDLQRHLVDLDHDDFAKREQASAELERWGALARPLLLQSIEQAGSPEEASRLREILDRSRFPLERFPNEHLRLLRGIEALERMPKDVSLDALRTIASREGDNLGARQARAALARLEARGDE
jgi:WD40 repeat protein